MLYYFSGYRLVYGHELNGYLLKRRLMQIFADYFKNSHFLYLTSVAK